MAENLNSGVMIKSGTQPNENDMIIQKYCYYDDALLCNVFGGLYTWNEMMSYQEDNKPSICPLGWKVPSDKDWKLLEGNVDSVYGVGDVAWDKDKMRGFDAGKNLKSDCYWRIKANMIWHR